MSRLIGLSKESKVVCSVPDEDVACSEAIEAEESQSPRKTNLHLGTIYDLDLGVI